MKLELIPLWRWSDGNYALTLEPVLFRLLAAIAQGGSLRAAADEVGVSYRHAWGLLGEWGQRFGAPLVEMSRGRGAWLTPLGETLLKGERLIQGRLAPLLEEAAGEFEQRLVVVLNAGGENLRICASHDLVLAKLPTLVRQQTGMYPELKFCGSLESLKRLRAGECDLAGFHVPTGKVGRGLLGQWGALLGQEYRLIIVARRRQGLMTAAGNPKEISGLADLTRAGVRFVNRQLGSGTRLALEAMLRETDLRPAEILGYENEEFTHSAVAAMVASGAADAALGLEAAAVQFGLGFVPLFEEQYFFALGRHKLQAPAVQSLLQVLQSEAFQRLVSARPGYDGTEAGKCLRVTDAMHALGHEPAGGGSWSQWP